ncbi:MAG: cell wall metabolism sensor histidine kinase WalK [Thermoanaerobacterales bacterium]|jgi:two-component system sensor histidine kinase VicK|nr:cell wall metabolism sensor histidine kinase WalK [Thermoanaerobacterales bacterium]
MIKSIQWKLVLIHILLILLAMEVVGAYLINSLESYHTQNLSSSLDQRAQLISNFIERYLNPEPMEQEIDYLILEELGRQVGLDIRYTVILDETASVLSSTDATRYPKGEKFLTPEVVQATFGTSSMDIREDTETNTRFMYKAHPVKTGDKVTGIIYLVSSMENIYNTLGDIKTIIFAATLMALVITGLLGYALSKTITGPIQEVTNKAALMARGDFEHKITVKSNDEIGKLTEMFNFLTTRLKTTMEEISDEKEKIEAILVNMADGVVALNHKGEVIHINPAARKMLSLDAEINDDDFAEKIKSLFNIHLEDLLEMDVKTSEKLVDIDGSIIKSINAPLLRNGKVVGMIFVLEDITKQRRLDDMRKEFVANVSHELRTPLTTIKSYTETLLDDALGQPDLARNFLTVVNNEADRMARLVNDLLELSRIDNRETSWDKKPQIASDLIKDVVSKMAINIEKDKVLEVDIPESDTMVFVDRDKMEQVIQNVLSNANKFTLKGGKISVKIEESDECVIMRFSDTGIGIPEKDIPRIFERFYRVDKTRSRQLGGTGLGLSIAKEIVEFHGGKIWIESKYGYGTQVNIMLPTLSSASQSSQITS